MWVRRKGRGMKSNHSTMPISVRLRPELYMRVTGFARGSGRSISKVTRLMLEGSAELLEEKQKDDGLSVPHSLETILHWVAEHQALPESELIAKGGEPVSLAGLLADVSVRIAELEAEVKRNGERKDDE